ncbi:MAG: hypothetical protein ACK526_03215 [Planctomyces sp.]
MKQKVTKGGTRSVLHAFWIVNASLAFFVSFVIFCEEFTSVTANHDTESSQPVS